MATEIHLENNRLGEIEYRLQNIYLHARPRYLGLVLSNRCNIGCVHCYQPKNGDSLLDPPAIGQELRREFAGLYPYLSTLRMQGGELFAIRGFAEILEDVSAAVDRPIVSISTNATLIDEMWAERIVRTPFQNVTVSIDAGTPETYARVRRGGDFAEVVANTRRILRWKEKLASPFPQLDSFFVVMRSNFREIPRFLQLAQECGITSVCFQTVEINHENSSRFPLLSEQESIVSASETTELHAILGEVVARNRGQFQFRFSGMTDLFRLHGLDASVLDEQRNGLYPDSHDLPAFELCPNPWTTLFVVENGDAHLCFLAQPVGNLYHSPLLEIWNSPAALMKRSHMIAGRYLESGCSSQWCSWRQGSRQPAPAGAEREALLGEFRQLRTRAASLPAETMPGAELRAVRRMLSAKTQRIAELESMFQRLCEVNQELHESGQSQIRHLEDKLRQSEAASDQWIADQDAEFSRRWEENQELHSRGQAHIVHLEERLSTYERDPLVRLRRGIQKLAAAAGGKAQ